MEQFVCPVKVHWSALWVVRAHSLTAYGSQLETSFFQGVTVSVRVLVSKYLQWTPESEKPSTKIKRHPYWKPFLEVLFRLMIHSREMLSLLTSREIMVTWLRLSAEIFCASRGTFRPSRRGGYSETALRLVPSVHSSLFNTRRVKQTPPYLTSPVLQPCTNYDTAIQVSVPKIPTRFRLSARLDFICLTIEFHRCMITQFAEW